MITRNVIWKPDLIFRLPRWLSRLGLETWFVGNQVAVQEEGSFFEETGKKMEDHWSIRNQVWEMSVNGADKSKIRKTVANPRTAGLLPVASTATGSLPLLLKRGGGPPAGQSSPVSNLTFPSILLLCVSDCPHKPISLSLSLFLFSPSALSPLDRQTPSGSRNFLFFWISRWFSSVVHWGFSLLYLSFSSCRFWYS